MKKFVRWSVIASAVSAIGLGSFLVVTSQASAATTSVPVATPMRACPDLGFSGCTQILLTVPSGSQVSMVCWFDSSWLTGRYNSNRWFVVKYGDREAWVHSSQVANQTAVGSCSSV